MHTMTVAPLATCRVEMEFERGSRSRGYSSDLLVPKWFEKNPDTPIAQDWADLLAAQHAAIGTLLADPAPATAFDHWRRLYAERVEPQPRDAPDLLVRAEGVSLVERAMIDAVCRAAGVPFAAALRSALLGFDAGALDPAVAGWSAGELPPPVRAAALRHTVGLLDAIEPGDIDAGARVNDGLPESLTEDIRAFGLTHFKIKITSDSRDQTDRLARVWSVIRREAGPGARVTLDGNEQFESIAQLVGVVERIAQEPRFAGLPDALLLIEQPLPRARTFDPASNAGMDRLTRYAPCIIDEADLGLWSFSEAAALGYRGVSIKNCKGVFRALLNRARCDRSAARLFQTGEDLTNLPILALQQDLATMATLGVTHIERNGHHYFRALDHLPGAEQHAAANQHPDLYTGHPGAATLRIERGTLALGSLLDAPGFGYAGPIDLAARTPAADWDPASLA
ncbi:MAG: hypothetical protein IT431_18050 [Phycisphaerales bacterium]|nr:hypothetical protein [Phycisphaerales bacterium]